MIDTGLTFHNHKIFLGEGDHCDTLGKHSACELDVSMFRTFMSKHFEQLSQDIGNPVGRQNNEDERSKEPA